MSSGAIFPRSFGREYPYALRREGVYAFDESGSDI